MKKVVLIIITVLLLASGSVVRAEIITIAIEATVDWVNDPCDYLEGNITPGDIITGTYTYDSDTVDSSPLTTVGDYWYYDSPFGISLSVDGIDFRTDPCNVNFLVEIINDHGPLNRDGYYLNSSYNLPLTNGLPIDYISWQLDDSTGQAISSIELPITAPSLTDWEEFWGLRLESTKRKDINGVYYEGFLISSSVTSAVVVPEPASIIAFGCAFIVLRKHGSRKDRRKH